MEEHPFTSDRWLKNLNNLNVQEKWFVNLDKNSEASSFAYMPNKSVSSIFLGSFPIWEIVTGALSNNMEFFYGSVVNEFWELLGKISGLQFDTLSNRLEILDQLNIGITDILYKVDRHPSNCSRDECLTKLKYNNILELKNHFPELKKIFITSGGRGSIQNLNQGNKSVATWFKDSVSDQTNVGGFNSIGFVKRITIGSSKFNLIYLFSPSGMANTSLSGILKRNNNFGELSLNINMFRKIQWGYFIQKYCFDEKGFDKLDRIYHYVNSNPDLQKFFEN